MKSKMCPFCGEAPESNGEVWTVIHEEDCFLGRPAEPTMQKLYKSDVTRWNIRAPDPIAEKLAEAWTYTKNGKTASAMGWATICANLEAEVGRLRSRLAEEIRYGHRHCTRGNCCSSGIDCPEHRAG